MDIDFLETNAKYIIDDLKNRLSGPLQLNEENINQETIRIRYNLISYIINYLISDLYQFNIPRTDLEIIRLIRNTKENGVIRNNIDLLILIIENLVEVQTFDRFYFYDIRKCFK